MWRGINIINNGNIHFIDYGNSFLDNNLKNIRNNTFDNDINNYDKITNIITDNKKSKNIKDNCIKDDSNDKIYFIDNGNTFLGKYNPIDQTDILTNEYNDFEIGNSCGLINIKNTCYFYVCLQIIAYLCEYFDLLKYVTIKANHVFLLRGAVSKGI